MSSPYLIVMLVFIFERANPISGLPGALPPRL
jgi:hypothetical protein